MIGILDKSIPMSDIFDGNNIVVYTDGSSLINKDYYEASSAIVITINGKIVDKLGCFHINGTNSLGEFYAMMMAIDKVEEIKNDNPELKDYFTIFVSDSKYVVSSLNEWSDNWAKSANYDYSKVWKNSSNSEISHQWIIKYLHKKYISNNEWMKKNIFIHTNGHINGDNIKEVSVYYNKVTKRNSYNMMMHRKFLRLESFKTIVNMNSEVDKLAEYIRINKNIYYENEESENKWEIKIRKNQVREKRIVIKSRKNKKEK